MKTALLLIDIQNDYFDDGKNPLENSLSASLKARELLFYFRKANLPIIHIRHISTRPGATFFLPGTRGAQTHENVQPIDGELSIEKHYPNSFRETNLLEKLIEMEIERVVVCGMMTHMCVDATTRAAFDFGFTCWLADDACASKDLTLREMKIPAGQVHAAFLAALKGTYARILSADEIITELGG